MGLHIPDGATADGRYRLVVTPQTAGWSYSGLRVLELPPGGRHALDTGEDELLVLPLSGGCAVCCDGRSFTLTGRADVFAGPTDFAYLPPGSAATIESPGGGRFALPSAISGRTRFEPRYGAAASVPVELRGAGRASRQVHNFCAAGSFDADRLIAVEVLTPGGNWSSYPPHKHDEEREDERRLEEIYYFELRGGPGAVGYQSTVDVLAEVRHGDTVLVPHGYHGPSMAPPGYDMYYLNVMAGPVREWRFRDDPAHAWIRDTWAGQELDPRLPFGGAR
jgi:5-deoxy-glucuronate isomerase